MPLSTYEDQTEKLIIEALEVSPVPMSVATLQRIAHIKDRKSMMVYLNCLCADKILVHHSREFYVIHPELRVAPEKEEQMETNKNPREEQSEDPDYDPLELPADDPDLLAEMNAEEVAEEVVREATEESEATAAKPEPKLALKAIPVRPPIKPKPSAAKPAPTPKLPASDPKPRVFQNKTSRYLGVSKKGNVWVVQGSVNGSPIPTKTFKDETLAARHFDDYSRRHATDPLNRRYNFPLPGEKNQEGERLPTDTAAAPHKPVAALREIPETIDTPPTMNPVAGVLHDGGTFTLDLAALARQAVESARQKGFTQITLSMETLSLLTKK